MSLPARYLAWSALLAAVGASAQEVPAWQVGEDSTLTFVAVQQGAPFEGRFERFEARIRFSPERPADGELVVTVETDSVDTGYDQRDEVLRSEDFFDVMRWPEARFEASEFRASGGDRYEARGRLTLRDQTHPLTVPFTFRSDGATAELVGEVVVPRLRFGIGQGEWADTTWIGADVTVRFDLQLTR